MVGRMFRAIVYLLITIFLISIVRAVVGVIMKGFSELMSPAQQHRATSRGPSGAGIPLADELKKDPVCGTYTAAATSIKQTFGKETVYFCSPQCRDKYVASH
jgi:YHS domain-containing protein